MMSRRIGRSGWDGARRRTSLELELRLRMNDRGGSGITGSRDSWTMKPAKCGYACQLVAIGFPSSAGSGRQSVQHEPLRLHRAERDAADGPLPSGIILPGRRVLRAGTSAGAGLDEAGDFASVATLAMTGMAGRPVASARKRAFRTARSESRWSAVHDASIARWVVSCPWRLGRPGRPGGSC